MDLASASAAWDKVRAAVKIQNEVLYQTHVQRSQVLAVDNGSWTIGVFNKSSQEWLTYRPDIVAAPLARLGYAPELTFVVSQAAAPIAAETPARVEPVVAPLDIYEGFFGEGTPGYGLVSHYWAQFWAPYLGGDAFVLWKRLDSDARANLKITTNRWSEPARYYYRPLARAIGRDHPRTVRGGPVECWVSLYHRRDHGQSLPECCLNPAYQPSQWRPRKDGLRRCMHWQTGLLEILYAEGLIAVELKQGERWSNIFRLQVWRLLPILTPSQTSRLNDDLQKDHGRWIDDFGDRFGLDQKLWGQIEAATLVTGLAGYQAGKQLDDVFDLRGRHGF